MSDLIRSQVVVHAESQVGLSDPATYWKDVLPYVARQYYPKHWCGAFALWCLHRANLAKDWNWVVGYPYGFLYNLGWTDAIVRTPKPGDIAYFVKHQHHAVVVDVTDTHFTTVDGNAGWPSKVRKKTRKLGAQTSFHSIEAILPHSAVVEPSPTVPIDPSLPANGRRSIRYGYTGADVKAWQAYVIAQIELGTFDKYTVGLTRVFQNLNGLTPDSIVGPKTRGAAGI